MSGSLDLFETSEADAAPGDGLHWPDVRGWLQAHPQMLLDDRSLLEEIRVLYDVHGFETQILAASLRNVAHVAAAAVAGSDAATFGADTFKALVKHPLTDRGVDAFVADWAKTGQSIL